MTDRYVDVAGATGKDWWVFRQRSTYYAFGTEETALRYLRFLNQNRAVNHFHLDRITDVFPTPTVADLESSPDLVDMEQEMKDWTG